MSHRGKKYFSYLSGGVPVLLAKVMKGKSSMTCIKTLNGTMQLEVCHSWDYAIRSMSFSICFRGFCHTGAELEAIKQRITSPKRLSATSLILSPSFFLWHAAVLESSSCSRVWCFAHCWGVCRSQVLPLCLRSFGLHENEVKSGCLFLFHQRPGLRQTGAAEGWPSPWGWLPSQAQGAGWPWLRFQKWAFHHFHLPRS